MSTMDGIKRPLFVPPPEPEVVSEQDFSGSLNTEAEVAAFLEGALSPQEIAWESHHTLSPKARLRHMLLAGSVGVAGVAIALWQSSWITAGVVILALVVWELRERFTRPVAVRVDTHGLSVDGVHHPYTELAGFDVHQMPDGAHEVSIRSARWHTPHMRLPLSEQDPTAVQEVLMQYLIKERHAIPLVEWWIRK